MISRSAMLGAGARAGQVTFWWTWTVIFQAFPRLRIDRPPLTDIHLLSSVSGGRSSVGRASDCDSECRGFKPRRSPQFSSPQPVLKQSSRASALRNCARAEGKKKYGRADWWLEICFEPQGESGFTIRQDCRIARETKWSARRGRGRSPE
jgi:hypothetical protein